MTPDEIVERWHNGEWPYRRLEDVMCEHTGWTQEEYDRWVTYGKIPTERKAK